MYAGASSVGVVMSAQSTNEDLYALARLTFDHLGLAKAYLSGLDQGWSDDILVSADKNPNTAGAMAIGATTPGEGRDQGMVEPRQQASALAAVIQRVFAEGLRQSIARRRGHRGNPEVGPESLAVSRRALPPADRLERSVVAFEAGDFRPRQHLDVGKSLDAVDQVARHAGLQARPAHQDPDLGDLARQIDHRLTGRIAGAHQGHLLPGAELAFERRSPIVHARRLEGFEALARDLDLEVAVALDARLTAEA